MKARNTCRSGGAVKKPREHQLNLSVSADEHAAIVASAAEAGLTPAAWCRLLLRYAAGMDTLGEQVKRARRAAPWDLRGQ